MSTNKQSLGSPAWLRNEAKMQAEIKHLFGDTDEASNEESGRSILALRDAANHIDDLAMFVRRLARRVRKEQPNHLLAQQALDYLQKNELNGNPLRARPTPEPKPAGEMKK